VENQLDIVPARLEVSRTIYIDLCLGCYTSLSGERPLPENRKCALCGCQPIKLSLTVPKMVLEHKAQT
jgi:hypothetical protein